MSNWNRTAAEGGVMKALRLLFALALMAAAQDILTNDSIVKMVKSGLGENLVVSMVQSQPGKYALTPDDLVKLKEAGVSENILAAMVNKGSGGGTSVRGAQPPAAFGEEEPGMPTVITGMPDLKL